MSEQKALRKYNDLKFLPNHRTWAEIDLAALRRNYTLLKNRIKELSPACRPVCVVKADAYSHSMSACVPALIESGADFFAVSSLEEALAVKKIARESSGDVRVLILGYTLPSEISLLIENNITQTVFSLDYAKELNEAARGVGGVLDVHIKLDTGMNRLGFGTWESEFDTTLSQIVEISSYENLSPIGIYTHFARADEKEADLTDLQASRFYAVTDALASRGIEFAERHVCNSALAATRSEHHLDLVRLGILLYGLSPSDEVGVEGLVPVMRLKTIVSHIHTLEVGETVSYGGRFSSNEKRVIATLPIGYADGFMRACTGGSVTIKGHDVAIVGSICMDQCMVDITDYPDIEIGDVVTVYGETPDNIERFARRAGTISYELVCRSPAEYRE